MAGQHHHNTAAHGIDDNPQSRSLDNSPITEMINSIRTDIGNR